MTLIADERVFQSLPVKTEAKVVMSGIYITQIKSVRGGAIPTRQRKRIFARFKKDKRKRREKEIMTDQSCRRGRAFLPGRQLLMPRH